MQLIINVQNESLVEKIVWFLETLKDKGVQVIQKDMTIDSKSKYTDEYLRENWKEMVMSSGDSSDYYKSEAYYTDRGNYLLEKYK
jgi:hypothetical protein